MENYAYLIVGGGMTAASALTGIRQLDTGGSVMIVGDESDPPYEKPPLSKGLWKGKALETVWMETQGAELALGKKVVSLNREKHEVLCADGTRLGYRKLLLATGGRPKRLPFEAPGVIHFRNMGDYRALREGLGRGRRVLVIGGGFIGSELAAALTMNGGEVVMVFPEAGIGARTLPPELALHLNDYYRSKGVEVRPGEVVVALRAEEKALIARGSKGQEIRADGVVAGLGINPNIELAQEAGLAVGDGIVVGRELRTADPDIYAAGDVASFECPLLGRRLRAEHEDNALAMGLAAGRNMAGAGEAYERLPYFYSDLFDQGYEAVGDIDPSHEIFIDWKQPLEKGVIYYHRQGRLRGVLLWNVWKKSTAARALIGRELRRPAEELAGLI